MTLDHLAGPVATIRDVTGRFVKFRGDSRVALAAFTPRPGVAPEALEQLTWKVGAEAAKAAQAADDRLLRILESYIFRGPDWATAAGVVKQGDWVLGVRCDPLTWDDVVAGRITARDLLKRVTKPQSTTRKGTHMGKKQELRAQLARAELALTKAGIAPPVHTGAPMSLDAAIRLMKSAADDAGRAGDYAKADGLRKEVALMKLTAEERTYQARGAVSSYGPGSRPLFARTGSLPDDTALGGI